jgi:hypothetical protein
MIRPSTTRLVVGALAIGVLAIQWQLSAQAPAVAVTRLASNPMVTVNSSSTLGGNVNGPSMIRVPDWIEHPLGKYYLYFANHRGEFIRLAYADAVSGPWKIYEPGVLHVKDTAFYRPQPDLARFGGNSTHLASPEVFIDAKNRRLILWAHGWFSNGERWPSDPAEAQRWANEHGYGQFTQASISSDGLHFASQPAITRESYLRVFQWNGTYYGMSRLGRLERSTDLLGVFELGPNPFRETQYGSTKVRHTAMVLRGNRLYVFFTAIGDAPERMMLSTIDLTPDWTQWKVSAPVEVMRPEAAYECVNLPVEPSAVGDVEVPVRQIRDPGIFEEGGRTYLIYSTCGEQGLALAEVKGLPQ